MNETTIKCSGWNCDQPIKYRVIIDHHIDVYTCCCNRVGLMQFAAGVGKEAKFYPIDNKEKNKD